MEKPIKQIIYLPVIENNDLQEVCDIVYNETGSLTSIEIVKKAYSLGLGQFKPQEGYFFTSEQLNEYTANVIKQALETAAEKALCDFDEGGCTEFVDKQSITNTFKETFKLFSVK